MLAIVRIRGRTGIRPAAAKASSLMRLHRINHMVVMEESATLTGMLQSAKDYITWGEIDQDTLVELLKTRALLVGRKPLTEQYIKDTLSLDGFESLAKSIMEGKLRYRDIPEIIPVFRLHPPAGGLEYIRKSVGAGGTAGYRGNNINSLIRRMLIPGVKVDGKN